MGSDGSLCKSDFLQAKEEITKTALFPRFTLKQARRMTASLFQCNPSTPTLPLLVKTPTYHHGQGWGLATSMPITHKAHHGTMNNMEPAATMTKAAASATVNVPASAQAGNCSQVNRWDIIDCFGSLVRKCRTASWKLPVPGLSHQALKDRRQREDTDSCNYISCIFLAQEAQTALWCGRTCANKCSFLTSCLSMGDCHLPQL